MTPRTTRREFILFVAGAAGAYLVSCRPADSSGEAAVPTLVSGGGSGGTGGSAPQPGGFSAPDPDFGQPTYNRDILITPTDLFYVQAYSSHPQVDRAAWTLTIDGLVDSPLTLTYDHLLRLEQITEMRTLECIGNPVGGDLVGNTTWTGVRLKPLLDQVGLQPSAIRARFYAADGYTTSVDLDWILHEDTLLIHTMNGEPLTVPHGYPLRIMMPGLYGQKMPKWLQRIEFIDHAYQGYWEEGGWSDLAAVKTNSQIASPPNLSRVSGAVYLQGWAYAGTRRITQVEVQVDGADWQPAELLAGPSPRVWTQWWLQWTPPGAGAFKAAVRCTDEDGFTQHEEATGLLDSSYPDGTSVIHSVAYTVQNPGG